MTQPAFPSAQQFVPPNDSTFRQIVHNGQYYFPASNHYQRATTVNCDRCQRSQIPACIGWREFDLCLGCAQIIVERSLMRVQVSPQINPLFSPRFDPQAEIRTRMQISSAYPKPPSQRPSTASPFVERISSAFPGRNADLEEHTFMLDSSAFSATNMQLSSAFPPRN